MRQVLKNAETNIGIYEQESQKIREKIDSDIAVEYCNVRIKGIWARMAFAALCGVNLAFMEVPKNIILIWFFLTFANQLFELNLSYKAVSYTHLDVYKRQHLNFGCARHN